MMDKQICPDCGNEFTGKDCTDCSKCTTKPKKITPNDVMIETTNAGTGIKTIKPQFNKKEYNKKYYIKNRKHLVKKSKDYYDNNKEQISIRTKSYMKKYNKSAKSKESKSRWQKSIAGKISLQRFRKSKKGKLNSKRYSDKIHREALHTIDPMMKCKICNISKNLSIDHINGNGKKEIKSFYNNNPSKFYRSIRDGIRKTNDLQILCMECNLKKSSNKKLEFKTPHSVSTEKYNIKLKNIVFKKICDKYNFGSIECFKCGIQNSLELDHIDGKGGIERKIQSQNKLFIKIRDDKISLNNFQILCHSCNNEKNNNDIDYRSDNQLSRRFNPRS